MSELKIVNKQDHPQVKIIPYLIKFKEKKQEWSPKHKKELPATDEKDHNILSTSADAKEGNPYMFSSKQMTRSLKAKNSKNIDWYNFNSSLK